MARWPSAKWNPWTPSRPAHQLAAAAFLNRERNDWGVESGLQQRLDGSAFEDRLGVRHQGAVQILGLFARVGVALFVRWAGQQRLVLARALFQIGENGTRGIAGTSFGR